MLHNTASPMEQQQQQPQTVSMQHASEQPGVQQPQPPLQTALDHHASEQQIMQQQDAGQFPEHPPEDTKQQAPAWQSYSSVFTAAKAGMGGVDQAKVKQVVYEMSKVIWSPHACMHARMHKFHSIRLTHWQYFACRTRPTLPMSSASKPRQTLASPASKHRLHSSHQHSWQHIRSELSSGVQGAYRVVHEDAVEPLKLPTCAFKTFPLAAYMVACSQRSMLLVMHQAGSVQRCTLHVCPKKHVCLCCTHMSFCSHACCQTLGAQGCQLAC